VVRRVIVRDFVVVPRDDPWRDQVRGLQVRVRLVLRVTAAVVVQRERFVLADGARWMLQPVRAPFAPTANVHAMDVKVAQYLKAFWETSSVHRKGIESGHFHRTMSILTFVEPEVGSYEKT